ncbi:MAG: helix-turn-helix domain-containing protein [Bacteroidetes bacterium]|nr:helix-turn-helix domain-containing protein [Bacteroidota bacterium]
MSYNVNFAVAAPLQIEQALCWELERIRLSKNITQAQLAVQAGVSVRTVRRMENGEGVSLETFIRVLTVLGGRERLASLLPNPPEDSPAGLTLDGYARQRARPGKAAPDTSTTEPREAGSNGSTAADLPEAGRSASAAEYTPDSRKPETEIRWKNRRDSVSGIPDWNPAFSETEWDQSLNARIEELEFDVIVEAPRTAEENLALDETLLYAVAERRRRPVFWLWDWAERAAILGSYQSVGAEFDPAVAEREGFRFARRISGGGAMVVEPQRTITWSIIVPESVVEGLSFRQSFAYLDMWAVRALRGMGIPASYRPINDIVSPVAKIGGAAQCRRRRTVLHHVTMAYAIDGAMMWKLLRLDKERTSEKAVPSAVKKVSPLSDFTDMSHAVVRERLAAAFAGMHRTNPSAVTPDEWADAHARIATKFATDEWKYRVR